MEQEVKKGYAKPILLGVGVLGLIVIFCVILIAVFKFKDREVPLEVTVRAATAVIDLRHGVDDTNNIKTDSDYISNAYWTSLNKYQQGLMAVDDKRFDITEYYDKNFSGADKFDGEAGNSPAVGDEEDDDVADSTPTKGTEDSSVVQDKRIKSENGREYMLVKDFDFSNGKMDIVAYQGIYMVIPKEVVPQSYASMLKDPNSYYKYDSFLSGEEGNKHYVDVLFKPLNEGKNIIVRMYNVGGKLIDFDVR